MITFGLGGLALLTEGLGNQLAYYGQVILRPLVKAEITFVDTTKQTFFTDKQTEIRETSPVRTMRETTPFVEIK